MACTSPRRLLGALVAVALAASLAACASSDDTSKGRAFEGGVLSAKDLALVADRTTSEGGVRLSMHQTMTLGDVGTIPATAEGTFDTKAKRGEMTLSMDLSAIPGVSGAAGAGDSKQQMIFDGTTFYLSSPTLATALPGAKKWIKVDLETVGKDLGIDFGALMQGASGQDPTQALQYLKAAAGDITRVGTETVRDEPTTHYKATIDFTKVPDTVPADQRAAMRRSIDEIVKLAGTSTAPIEVWIGDDGLVRRYATTIDGTIAGRHTKVVQRIELYDFGAKVDVKIPSADETVDIGDLGGQSSDSSSGSGLVPG